MSDNLTQIPNFCNPQNWFHVKSEWQKNHEISILCKLTYALKLKVKFSVFDKNHSRSLFFFSSCFALFCLFMFENWEQINARNRRVILPSNANFNVILATFGNIWRLSKPMNPKPVAIMLVNKINFSVFVKSENWK